jgi:MFS family permease
MHTKSLPLHGSHSDDTDQDSHDDSKPLPLTSRVLIATSNYAALGLFDISLRALIPVFYATPVDLGGLGLDPPRIGNILAVFGIVNGLFQVFFFAWLHGRFGTKTLFACGITLSVPIIIGFPIINMLGRTYGIGMTVWLAVGLQLALSIPFNMCFGSFIRILFQQLLTDDSVIACGAMYIAAASPNRASLGATNGLAQTLAACARIIGPASTMSMFSFSVRDPSNAWAVYYFTMVLAFLAIGASSLLPHRMWKRAS